MIPNSTLCVYTGRVNPMFVSQAHSFQQQARLSITLAWVAGYINVITLIACGITTSHMSGNTTALGHGIATGAWNLAGFTLFLLATFFLGAAISGLCLEAGRRRGWESIYVFPIIVETALLALFAILLEINGYEGLPASPLLFVIAGLAAAAMGLQNATITHISHGQVRTTHVTGVLTDLGQETTQFLLWLRDRRRNVPPGPARGVIYSVFTHPPARHIALLASILGSFALGAGLGTLALQHAPRAAMFPPVAFLLWLIYQDFTRPIAEIEPSSLVDAANGMNLPSALAVFHLRKDHDRKGRVHRMPNLLAWSERLPTSTRVVILDLGEVTILDANALLELRALLSQFENQNRNLIISGLNPTQLDNMHALGMQDLLQSENMCADLELAIARGLNLITCPASP